MLLFFALLILVQCTDDTPAPTTKPATPTPAATPTATAGPTATPFATPTAVPSPTTLVPPENLERGGILRFAVPQGSPHLDPHMTVSSGLLTWGPGQSYSRLFKFDTRGNAPTVTCDLCSSWEQTGPLTFKIKLREDVEWQNLPPLNGRKLTAQDVVSSLERQATPGFPNAALLSNITEFTVVGEHEIVIRLEVPDSETLEKLADSHSRIVATEIAESNGDLRRGPTVGSGPWITSEALFDRTALVVNPDYYGDQVPYLDGLEIQVIPSVETRVAGMRSRFIDLVQADVGDVSSAMNRFDSIEWTDVPNPAAGVEIAINTARSPMDIQAVREAMMFSWDPGADVNVVVHSDETSSGQSYYGRIGVGVPILNPRWLLPREDFENLFNDADKANSLLASAGLRPTAPLIIKVGEYGQQYIDHATALAEGLASVGIPAQIERITTRKFGDEVWIAGDYDISVGAPPPVSSTTAYLFSVHHSAGPWNSTGYSDPEIDRLIEAQAHEYDATRRGQLLLEIQRRILAGSHRFISSTRTTYWMWWDHVNDFNPITPRGDSDFLLYTWMTERPEQ